MYAPLIQNQPQSCSAEANRSGEAQRTNLTLPSLQRQSSEARDVMLYLLTLRVAASFGRGAKRQSEATKRSGEAQWNVRSVRRYSMTSRAALD